MAITTHDSVSGSTVYTDVLSAFHELRTVLRHVNSNQIS